MLPDRDDEIKKLISHGFNVLPCRPGEKVPATAHGCKDATADLAKIDGLFADGENVAIATGDGIFVIDFDTADGPAEFEESHEPLPQTVGTMTPRGGIHWYFRSDKIVKNSQSKLAPKVDVRGQGGYVMCPPSVVNGKAYQWLPGCSPDEIAIADAPSWLTALVCEPPVKAAPPRPAPSSTPVGSVSPIERARKYISKMPPAISGQRGHDATLEVAGVCFRFGLDQGDTWTLLNEFNATCQPEWSEKELRHKMEDAYKLVQAAGEIGIMLDSKPPRPAPRPRPTATATAATAGTTIQLTDVGNGIRLAQRHGDKIRFVAGIGWHIWDGVRWRLDETQEIQRLAKETCRAMLAESVKIDNSRDREALAKHALASEGNFRLQAMISMAASESGIAIRAAEMDSDPLLLNAKNGIVDLRDGTLHPHRPEFLMTKLAPVVYDPKATCPRFDQFLNEIFDDNIDLLQFVITLLGMCLTGDITEQILPIFWGEGQNGKSTLIGVVMHIMGDYAGLAPDTLLMIGKHDEHPCELADMQGLRLVVASETESAGRLKIQLIKRLTGDPTIKARRMRENYYEFPRTHKTLLQTNNKPRINENSIAVWRRIKLIPFNVIFTEAQKDTELPKKLEAEASGILNVLIAGCLAWQRQKKLIEPVEVLNATADYRMDSDPLRDFIDERCVKAPNAWTLNSEIYGAYVRWAESCSDKPMGSRAFSDAISRHGFTATRKHDGRGWQGVKLGSEYVPNSEVEL
ncbi:MAG: phage/plasmid primase, P4 family [Phycisphaerae bacterium]